MNTTAEIAVADRLSAQGRRELATVRNMVAACMQCGTCSATCPNAPFMDATPRRMWRMVLMNRLDSLFSSKTFWLCSACYACTLRCPRGLPLTSAMGALKRLAGELDSRFQKRNGAFYHAFMNNVRKYGRVQESALMFKYFIDMKDPLLPLSFTSLGLKMAGRGKLHPPSSAYRGKLEPLFDTVRRMEGES